MLRLPPLSEPRNSLGSTYDTPIATLSDSLASRLQRQQKPCNFSWTPTGLFDRRSEQMYRRPICRSLERRQGWNRKSGTGFICRLPEFRLIYSKQEFCRPKVRMLFVS